MKNKQERSSKSRENVMERTLQDFWAKDVWNVIECPLRTEPWIYKGKNIFFDRICNASLRTELKYFFASMLIEKHYSVKTVFNNYKGVSGRMFDFFNTVMPRLNSVVDVRKEKLILQWRTYLEENGIKTLTPLRINAADGQVRQSVTSYISVMNRFYDYMYDFYDEREEFEKDRWDVRNLGLQYNVTSVNYYLDFRKIPNVHRALVKRYIKLKLLDQMSIEFMTAIGTLKKLDYFFAFLHQSHPDWVDMRNLSRNDIEGFLHFLRTEPMGGVPGGQKATNSHVNTAMGKLRVFIEDIQRYGWSESPLKPVGNLIYPEDYPKRQETNPNTVKYIPDYIWDLVLSNIDQFKREYIPILLVMEATGFRVSDVLMLKLDCLTKDKTGWWIIGDQRKVKYKDHRVPVTEEIAAVVQSQIELVRKVSTAENNPERYLFATFTGKRKGYPITSNTMRNNLNALARKCHILDENGRPYKFKNHAFRHRYGVTLLNNGMDIVIVQQLMAHASPEMTIVYAKILDETKRKEWEKVRATGAFAAIRISEQGKIVPATLEEQVTENGLELEWIRHNFDSIRLDHGICVKNPKIKCTFLDSVLEPPCIKNNCRSFHVDSTFIDYYKQQISKMEEDITAYKKANRLRSIELIEPKLKKYKEILSGLQNGNGIFGLEKSRREYTGDERERVATSVE